MSAPPSTQEPPKAEPPPPSFENFMSDTIGAALKENPNMPALEKERSAEPAPAPAPGTNGAVVAPAVEPTPAEPKPVEAKGFDPNFVPDLGKLAFGEPPSTKVKPEETKPAAPAPPVDIELAGKVTPQVEQAFASYRKANKALYEQNAQLTTQLKESQDKLKEYDGKLPMDKGEFERLSTERETLIQDLRLVKLEATPEYKAAITKPMEQIDGELKRLSAKYSINEHQLRRAMVEADPDRQSEQLGALTETFNDRDKLNLFKIADASLEIANKKNVLLKDVQQALSYIEAKHEAEAQSKAEATKTEWSRSLNKAWEVVGDAIYLARPIEGNDQWNGTLNEAKTLVANTNLEALNTVDRAKVMVQAALLPRACLVIRQLWDMYSEAAKTVQRYQGVTPRAGGGDSGAGTEAQPPRMPEEMSFVDAMEARIKGKVQ